MREPSPWYRASTDAWYVQLHGKQVRLAKGRDNRTEAKRKLKVLLAAAKPIATDRLTTAQLCDRFLAFSKVEHTHDTFIWHRNFLQKFCDHYGNRPTDSLIPHHMTEWIAAHPTWKGGRMHAKSIVKRAFSWALQEGLISKNPFADVVVGKSGRRTRVLSAAEREEILRNVRDPNFRNFITALQETGCRPGEVASVTAADVDLKLGVWILQQHKTAKKTGKDRIIYLTPTMVELTQRLVEANPSGPLFRGRQQRPLTNQSIRLRFRYLRKKLPHLPHFSAYSYRHTYCTDALVNGVGIAHVAELMGHTSTEMVSRVYSKLSQQVAHMREAAAKATTTKEQ